MPSSDPWTLTGKSWHRHCSPPWWERRPQAVLRQVARMEKAMDTNLLLLIIVLVLLFGGGGFYWRRRR